MRRITYAAALREAMIQEMDLDPAVFVYGIGVPTHAKVFGTVDGLPERFPGRVLDTPISESAMTGFGIGAAVAGLRPIHIHIRADFLIQAMGQIANMMAPLGYGSGGQIQVPITIRVIVGRGWGQGWQHSKSLHSVFAHLPGIKVVAPTRARDAKGLLAAAIRDDSPVIVIEHRWLYWAEDDVPEDPYTTPIGIGDRIRTGDHLTVVATSWMNVEALKAAEILARAGVEVDLIDPRTLAPYDGALAAESARRTGCCLIADNDWIPCGFGAEVAAQIAEQVPGVRIRRIGWAPVPCPTVRCLENEFYPNAAAIVRAAEEMLGLRPIDLSGEDFFSHERRFTGPF